MAKAEEVTAFAVVKFDPCDSVVKLSRVHTLPGDENFMKFHFMSFKDLLPNL